MNIWEKITFLIKSFLNHQKNNDTSIVHNDKINDVKEIVMEEQITKNFTLSELTYSDTALKKGIKNIPSNDEYQNMKSLCENVLQPLRDALGKPIIIHSCFRNEELNKAVGGSSTSQHVKGSAADFHVNGMNMKELAEYIKKNFKFDQLILEYSDGPSYSHGWCHVSWKNEKDNRQQCLTINKSGTKVGLF